MHQAPTRPDRRTHAGALVVGVVAVASCLTVYAFSRVTGRVGELVVLPVGSLSLVTGLLLMPLMPRAVGFHRGVTGNRWRLVLGTSIRSSWCFRLRSRRPSACWRVG